MRFLFSRFSALVLIITFISLTFSITETFAQTCFDVLGRSVPCPDPTTPPEPVSPPDADGDGVADGVDQCPNSGGPAQNIGCPLPADADGDGTPDIDDLCPNEGGHELNNGCPESSLSNPPPPISLPPIASDGPCLIATLGSYNVNVRQTPEANAQIIGQLIPSQTYPVSQKLVISIPENNIWYATQGGWVFTGVVRVEGDCSNLMTVLQRESSGTIESSTDGYNEGVREIALNPDSDIDPLPPAYYQICENAGVSIFTEAQTIVQCDDDSYNYDGLERIFECDGEIAIDTLPEGCTAGGTTPLERESDDSLAGIGLHFGYSPVNPILATDNSCWQGFGANLIPLLPDPVPPPSDNPLYPVCMMLANDINFGGTGNPALIIPVGEGNALLIPFDVLGTPLNINHLPEHGLLLIGTVPPDDGEEIRPLWAIVSNNFGVNPLRDYMSNPPDDGIFTGVQFSNGVEIILGESESSGFVCPSSELSFNPQPEPPAVEGESSNSIFDGISIVGFNPQPEPPAVEGESSNSIFEGISIVGFNPQPEPPAVEGESSTPLFEGISIVGFNPQPEPPAVCFEIGS